MPSKIEVTDGLDFHKHVKRYRDDLWNASMDENLRRALDRGVESFRSNKDEAFKAFPESAEKARRLLEVKDWSLLHLDELVKQTRDMVEDLHGSFFLARTVSDAMDYIGDQVEEGDIIVKSKSMTSEELHINPGLEEIGCEVYETDLGEFIVQKMGVRPMHITAPAVHLTREQVADLFTEIMGRKFTGDIPELVAAARDHLRDVFTRADIGISGANAIAAETGTTFIMENEGNARLVTGLPDKHIIISGLEKIVPTLMDGMLVIEVTARYANYKAPTYVNLITGPSKTGDIEKTIVYGAHGPKEVHLVLLDNNRTEVLKDEVYRQALRCIRCGCCLYECTVYPLVAGYFGYLYMGGIGAILTRYLLGGEEKASPIAYTCTLCGRCTRFCPMEIDVKTMVEKLRMEMAEKGLVPEQVKQNIERYHI